MSLYEIVTALRTTQGNIAKQAILDANKGNPEFKAYMKATYDVGLNYYQKKLPKGVTEGKTDFEPEDVDAMINNLASRTITGANAVTWLKLFASTLTKQGQELLQLILDRSIGASVGDTMVLKTWPDLYFIPPYQRCSLMDDKAKARFGKLKRFYVQTKADGSFAYVVRRLDGSTDVITRQGSKYPAGFADDILQGEIEEGNVLVGELLVGWWKCDKTGLPVGEDHYSVEGSSATLEIYDRKTGNGILNSVLKGGELEHYQMVTMQAWDMLLEEEFVAGRSTRTYQDRYEALKEELDPLYANAHPVSIIPTWEVGSLQEAYAIYTDHTARGLEGCVAKNPESFWKDGTSKDDVKMKLKFEAEFRCTGMYEGEGKAKGMMGGINVTTEDGLVESNCGTGFDDKQRKLFWDNPTLIVGEVVMLSANDLIQSRDTRKKVSLSLPVFEEVRYDKKHVGANTLPEVEAIVKAAKDGK